MVLVPYNFPSTILVSTRILELLRQVGRLLECDKSRFRTLLTQWSGKMLTLFRHNDENIYNFFSGTFAITVLI